MKRFLCLALSFLLVLGFSISVFAEEEAAAADAHKVVISATPEKIEVGDQFLISFTTEGEGGYIAFQLGGSFDDTTAEILASMGSADGMGIFYKSLVQEKGSFVVAGMADLGTVYEGKFLCSLLFKAKAAGDFWIKLGQAEGEETEVSLGKVDTEDKNEFLYPVTYEETFSVSIVDNTTEGSNVVIPEAEILFGDLAPYGWAQDAVLDLNAAGALAYLDEEEFYPAEAVTRGDFMHMLIAACGLTAENAAENFSDVPADSYYAASVAVAKALGIARGTGEGFSPEASVTRQDLCALVYRMLIDRETVAEVSDLAALEGFSDSALIKDYAAGAMASMIENAIIIGNADKTLNPLGDTTRAEAAVIISKVMALMKK